MSMVCASGHMRMFLAKNKKPTKIAKQTDKKDKERKKGHLNFSILFGFLSRARCTCPVANSES